MSYYNCNRIRNCQNCCAECNPNDCCSNVSVTVGTTATGEPGTDAMVTNSGTQCNAVLNFTIPAGLPGGDGQAATIEIGTVTTTDNCEDVSVTNSGTSTNAVFDFVIPCGNGSADLLKAINAPTQSTVSEGALTFSATPISLGDAITHVNGSPNIIINEEGYYQAVFNAVVTPTDAAVPENLVLSIYINGNVLSGASAVHHFESTEESANMTVTAFFEVSEVPAAVQIIANATAFSVEDASLTVLKIAENEE